MEQAKQKVDAAKEIIELLKQNRHCIGFAESCTGGAICARLVQVAGASEVVAGSIVSYQSKVKVHLLHVDADWIAKRGAVNEPCAIQMALGALQNLECDVALSITGVVGPTKSDLDPEIGTAYIAFASDKATVTCQRVQVSGSRQDQIEKLVDLALDFMHTQISK